MALEQVSANVYVFDPAPFDVHGHPRITDPLVMRTDESTGLSVPDGKAGLAAYTETMLRSGFGGMNAMPNEQRRVFAVDGSTSRVDPYAITDMRRATEMQQAIETQSVIPTGLYLGVDPKQVFTDPVMQTGLKQSKVLGNFMSGGENTLGLKIYGDESTGGFNIHPQHIPCITELWHGVIKNKEKPVILHLEDENVGRVLGDINKLPDGKNIPIHVAHVSSRAELDAVLAAKKAGMNVTCEVTVHHLLGHDTDRDEIGGYAWVKPTLKSKEDADYLMAHIGDIDIIASDCAPHREADKEADKPAYGLATHSTMMQMLIGLVVDSKMTMDQLYQKICVKPRQRFNIPIEDGSYAIFDTGYVYESATALHGLIRPRYGFNPFPRMEQKGHTFHVVGRLLAIAAGKSLIELPDVIDMQTDPSHFITPQSSRVI